MICVEEMSSHKVSMCHRTPLPNIEALARNVSDRPLVRSRSRRNLVEEKNTNKHGKSPPNMNIYYLWSCRGICGRGRGSWNNRRELLSFLEAHRNVHLARPRTLISIFYDCDMIITKVTDKIIGNPQKYPDDNHHYHCSAIIVKVNEFCAHW